MKYILEIIVVFNVLLLSAGIKVSVVSDRGSRQYRCGEQAVFTISVKEKNIPLEYGVVKAVLSNGTTIHETRIIDLSQYENDKIRINGTSVQPDLLRCDVSYTHNGKEIKSSSCVIFDPEKIIPALPEPDDFKSFWDDALLESRTFPAVKTEFTGRNSLGCRIYNITIPVPGGVVRGFLSYPPEKGKYPVIIQVPGAGAGMSGNPASDKEFIWLSLNVHQYDPENCQQEYKKLCAASHAKIAYSGWGAYIYDGAEYRKNSYYYRVLLGISRAVDYVASLPEAIPEKIGYCGVSQGGGIGLMLAGLNKKISAITVGIPAFCDHGAFQKKRAEAWPEYGKFFRSKNKQSFSEVLYFDAANFSRYINCPVRITAGMKDTLCPLPAVLAAWSVIPSCDKRLFMEPETAHGTGSAFRDSVNWLKSTLKGEKNMSLQFDLPVTADQWNGFDRYNFRIADCDAWIVKPKVPAPGNKWMWCMEFPDAFTPRCGALQLLEKGYYIAHIVVGNTYGCPAALKQFEKFYEFAVKSGLSSRVVLQGLSRGGLYAYRFAEIDPDRISVIYGDHPVCDIKSWPGGKGKGSGSQKDWLNLIKLYGFKDEAEALAWQGNPVDRLQKLADAGVKIIHVVGDSDSVVPYEENSLLVEKRYPAMGGEFKIILKKGIDHHPHGLDDPSEVVDFIMRNN